RAFDDNELAFLYQEHLSDGRPSRFNKLVSRQSVALGDVEVEITEGQEHASSNAIDLLKRDHRQVEELFAQVLNGQGTLSKAEVSEQIKLMLQVHTQLEEEIFYPALRDASEAGARLVERALDDHATVDD